MPVPDDHLKALGRVVRLVLQALSEYYDRDRSRFYKAIQGVGEQGMDLTGWLEFFVDGVSTQLTEVKARGEMAIRSDVLAKKHGLNLRQAGILDQLSSQGAMSPGDLGRRFPEINRRTLQRDIKGMVDKGLLREAGTGPTDPNRHYVPGKL